MHRQQAATILMHLAGDGDFAATQCNAPLCEEVSASSERKKRREINAQKNLSEFDRPYFRSTRFQFFER
jgi:hypothetical protein